MHYRNPKEGNSTSGVGNPCAPRPLNISLSVPAIVTVHVRVQVMVTRLLECVCVVQRILCGGKYRMQALEYMLPKWTSSLDLGIVYMHVSGSVDCVNLTAKE